MAAHWPNRDSEFGDGGQASLDDSSACGVCDAVDQAPARLACWRGIRPACLIENRLGENAASTARAIIGDEEMANGASRLALMRGGARRHSPTEAAAGLVGSLITILTRPSHQAHVRHLKYLPPKPTDDPANAAESAISAGAWNGEEKSA